MNRILFLIGAMVSFTQYTHAQCLDFASGPYNNLSIAPCEEGSSFEITDFEVFASEAYTIGAIKQGGQYSFSICNGDGVGAWEPDFTILSPSGAVDNFGEGDGDSCTITWTASESGEYLIIINEADSCGIPNTISNGHPMITTLSGGNPCPEMMDGAESFEEDGSLPDCWMTVDEDGDAFNWEVFENTNEAFDGDYTMISYSWYGDPVSPDNYLISPQLQMGEDESLYYVVRAGDTQFPGDQYSIMVSTTGTEIADFTDEVFTEVLTSDIWQGRTVDLSAYNGENIYLAFRHHGVTDVLYFLIDAVKLPGTIICSPDGIFNPDELSNIQVFPNPSNGYFKILNSGPTDSYIIRIFDVTGRQIKEEKVLLNNGALFEVNLSAAASGIYSIHFVSPDNSGALRVLKN